MYKLEHNKVPKLCNSNFVKTTTHYEYGTRQATGSNYFLSRVGKKTAQNQYFLEDQNYGVQINFKSKINNGIHLRNNIFSPYLSLTGKFASKLQLLLLYLQFFALCNLGLFICCKNCVYSILLSHCH